MKKLALAAALGLAGLALAPAHAADTSSGFNVVINLTSKCEITTASIGDLTMNYTSFQTTAATGSTSFDVRCTNTLPYHVTLGSANATPGNGFGSQTPGATNLNYTLTMGGYTGTGTGSNVSHTINGTIAANQAGTCAASTCTDTLAKTVYINY